MAKAKATKTNVKKAKSSNTSVKASRSTKAAKAVSTSTKAAKVKAKAGAAKDLADLYEDGLKDIYWAEKELKKALPKMQKNTTNSSLKNAFANHLKETETHLSRLESCFEELGKKAKAAKCDAMAGLLDEGKGIMEATEVGAVRDAGLIAAAQKVEHYEIATYGTLAAFAKVLGHKKGLKLLLQTLEEEKNCDEILTQLADTNLNSKAE